MVYFPRKAREIGGIAPGLREAIRALVTGQAPWPLFLHGNPGTGKTCAALTLLDHAGGMYWTANGLADAISAAMHGRLSNTRNQPVSLDALWVEMTRCSLVVIDELGQRGHPSDHHYEQVKKMLDIREGAPLLAISNLDLEELARSYDERVSSRLALGTVLHLRGDDQRLQR